ncbi:MAG: hypothetical protein AMXMBFR33_12870 [Candidatus Xenobia bacterium]
MAGDGIAFEGERRKGATTLRAAFGGETGESWQSELVGTGRVYPVRVTCSVVTGEGAAGPEARQGNKQTPGGHGASGHRGRIPLSSWTDQVSENQSCQGVTGP